MLKSELYFDYPESLVATEPQPNFRAAFVARETQTPQELNAKSQLIEMINPGDVLVINNTRVERRRVTTQNGIEILFLKEIAENEWQVLCPARAIRDEEIILLPGEVKAQLTQRGLPQILKVSQNIAADYFATHGELALPPYIQKARGERHNREQEEAWYQTAWAKNSGSQASPTASLHFDLQDLEALKQKGVQVCELTLHVGMGTFLPIKVDNIDDHKMHSEEVTLPNATVQKIIEAKRNGKKVWALGTTALRALEGFSRGHLKETDTGDYFGQTDIFIKPGYQFEVVDCLLTNFHQPESTLLALVMAFAGRERVLQTYDWAIKNNFKLFSYGDLTIWGR
jgi:S-adenosylmethionine:tRNA ribosyltransferase-isomerase